jgi:hypothetical protein
VITEKFPIPLFTGFYYTILRMENPGKKMRSWKKRAIVGFLCLAVWGILSILPVSSGWAKDDLFFFDYTPEHVFAPLEGFLEDALHRKPRSFPKPPLEDLKKGVFPDTLMTEGDVLLFGYAKEGWLFFEVWDLGASRKVLGMVRRLEESAAFLEAIKRRIPGILRRAKEWKVLFVRQEGGRSFIVFSDLAGERETSFPFPESGGMLETITMTPDGQSLLAVVSCAGVSNIFRIDLYPRRVQRLSLREFSDFSPTFSPCRGTILFLSERGGKKGIYEMNLDGSKQRELLVRGAPLGWLSASRYTETLAFSEYREGRWKLVLWNLLEGREDILNFPGNVLYPTFGGREQLFFIGEKEGRYDVYEFSPQKSWVRLTDDGLPKAYLAAAPDGQRLTFCVEKDPGNWDVVVLDLVKRRTTRLTASWAREQSPVFAPLPMY